MTTQRNSRPAQGRQGQGNRQPQREGGGALARQEQPTARIQVMEEALAKSAAAIQKRLGDHFSANEMIALVLTTMRRNPFLATCDAHSVIGCTFEAAQLGLRFDNFLGHAYMVPFKNGKRNCFEAQLVIGYRGMIMLATRGGEVQAVWSRVVYERDFYDVEEGVDPRLVHKPYHGRDRGNPIAVYAAIHQRNGVKRFRAMDWWEIEDLQKKQLQAAGERWRYSPWNTSPEEMAKKTPVRRELKYTAMSAKDMRGVLLDDLAEAGVSQRHAIIGAEIAREAGVELPEPVPPPMLEGDDGPDVPSAPPDDQAPPWEPDGGHRDDDGVDPPEPEDEGR